MCTVQPDVNVDEEEIRRRLAEQGTSLAPTATATTPTATASGFNIDKTGIVTEGNNPGDTGDPGPTPTPPPAATDPTPGAGVSSGQTNFLAADYLTANPDVSGHYATLSATPEGTAQLNSMGIHNADQYAAYHAVNHGTKEGRPGVTGATFNPTGAVAQGNSTLDTITSGFNKTIADLAASTAAATKATQDSNQGLLTGIADIQKSFQTAQQDLLDNMNKAAAAQSQAFSKALKDARDAGNSTGQQAKKPNYKRALDRNRELALGGIASTAVTGAKGVSTGDLSLGRTSLLGA